MDKTDDKEKMKQLDIKKKNEDLSAVHNIAKKCAIDSELLKT